MAIELNGFDDLMKDFKAIPRELDRASDKGVARAAHLLRGHVIKTIDSQPSDWAELDPDYLAKKIKARGSSKKLISGVRRGGSHVSGHYRNSFEVHKLATAEYAVGSNHPQARVLEFGFEAKNIKARPHLTRALEENREELADEIRETVAGVFRK